MKVKMKTDNAKALYKNRKQSVETMFGITKAATEWTLITLAYNCRRIHRLQTA